MLDAVDLEIHRLGAVDDHVVLGLLVADVDPVGVPREQVDGRCAVEREGRLVDERAQSAVRPRQRDRQLDLFPGVARQGLLEAGELHEPEALGKGEVLVEQSVAAERARRIRDQRLLPGEADGLDGLAAEPFEPRKRTRGRADEHAEPASDDQLVELQRDLVAGGQKQTQPVHGDLLERVGRGRTQAQTQHRLHRLREGQRVQRKIGRERDVPGLDELDGPERQLMGRAELARRHLTARNLSAQRGAPRHREAGGQRAFRHGGRHLDDRHGRRRREIVRIDALEEMLGEARKLGVELEAHPGGEEAEPFQEPLDVRIGHLGRVERQARGDLGERGGELRSHLPHVRELLAVVPQHPGVHQRPSTSRISPLSRSMSVLIKSSTGYG